MNLSTLCRAPLIVLLAFPWPNPPPPADEWVALARDEQPRENKRAAAQPRSAGTAAAGHGVEREPAAADAQAGQWLVELGNGPPDVRERIAADLGRRRDARAVAPLARGLADSDAEVRRAVIESLAEIGGVDAARALAVALRDSDARIREAAVNALGDIGGPTSIALLHQALGDVSAFVRHAAADTLEELKAAQNSYISPSRSCRPRCGPALNP